MEEELTTTKAAHRRKMCTKKLKLAVLLRLRSSGMWQRLVREVGTNSSEKLMRTSSTQGRKNT
jgi:hypothetical protein